MTFMSESEEMEKVISCKWKEKQRTEVAMFISDKIDVRSQTVKRWWWMSLYSHKRVYSATGYNDCKYICTQQQSISTYKANIKWSEGRHKLQHSNTREIQYPIFDTGQIIQTENQWVNTELKLHFRPDEFNKHM